MRKLIIAVLSLAVVAVLVDFGSAAYAEYRVSRAVRDGGNLTADPSVTFHGFPFLAQVATGRYRNVEIRAQGIESPTLGQVTVEANLLGARAEASDLLNGTIRQIPVEHLYGRMLIDATELGQLYGIPDLQISAPPANPSDGTGGSGGSGPTTAGGVVLTGTVPVGPINARVSVEADLVTDGDTVRIVASGLSFGPEGHTSITVPDALLGTVLQAFSTTIPPENLPFGLRPTLVEARGANVVIEGEATDTVIDLDQVQTP